MSEVLIDKRNHKCLPRVLFPPQVPTGRVLFPPQVPTGPSRCVPQPSAGTCTGRWLAPRGGHWAGEIIKPATNVREIEKNEHDTLHKDYSESVEALQPATAVKKQSGDHKHGAFVQMAAFQEISFIPQEAKAPINAFLQDAEPTESLAGITPDANAHEFQSSIVVEMLEKLTNSLWSLAASAM